MILTRILLVVIMFFVFLIPYSFADPVITNLTITPSKAYTINDLTCSFAVVGSNEKYGANISWYVRTDSSWSLNSEESKSCSNNTLCSFVLSSSNTMKSQTWNCSVIAYNTTSATNSTTRAISNSPPDFDPVDRFYNANESQFFSKLFSATDYDNDNLTYFIKSSDVTKVQSFSCYGGSASSGTATFSISSSNGNLTFNASRSEVGNYTVGISTQDNDTSPITTTLFVNFSINCVYLPPVLGSIANQTIEFNRSFSLQVSYTANDADNLTFEDNATFFNISSTGLISFTANNSNDVGEHIINISMNDGDDLYDPGNYSYSRIVRFIIVKPPIINWTNVTVIDKTTNNRTSVNETISANENTVSILFNSSSYDNPSNENITGYGNLTYQWKRNGTVMSNNQSWLFEPDYGDRGSYNITLEVRNHYNFTAARSWNLTINKTYRTPLFKPDLRPKLVIKYGNQTTTLQENSTGKDTYIYGSSNYGSNETLVVDSNYNSLIQFNLSSISSGINITEAILFLYLVSGKNTSSSIAIYRVTSNWEENEATWTNRTANATWSSSGGDYNNTVYTSSVSSIYNWYNWTVTDLMKGWHNGTFDNNGMIIIGSTQKNFASFDYKESIPGDTLTENVDKQTDIYINQYFLDIDGEGLTYNYSANSNYLTITISNSSRVVYRPTSAGTTYVTFSAKNPGNNTAESNSVRIVIQAQSGTQTPTVAVTTWITTTVEQTRKASLDIVISPIISADPSSEITIPFELENSGEVVLGDIDLSLESNIPNASVRLSNYSFDEMLVDERVDVNLTIITRDIEPARYNITIRANVSNPGIEQSTMVYIDILKIGKEIQKEILFAKDLFEENPECLEFMVTLDRAQEYMNNREYDKARNIIRSSMENCKALIKYKEKEIPAQISPDLIRDIVIILFSGIVIFYIILRVFYFKTRRFEYHK